MHRFWIIYIGYNLGCLVQLICSTPSSAKQRLQINPGEPIEMPTLDSLVHDASPGSQSEVRSLDLGPHNINNHLPFDHAWLPNDIGSIFDTDWDPTPPKRVDSQKDLVQPDETHLEGVPFFLKHPKPLYYTMKGHPATIDCIAEPVSHAVIECAEQVIPYKGPDESGRLKVTRLDGQNQPDPNGKRWHLELQVRAKEVEEWFDSYVCRCEAWNKVVELQRPKKVVSKEAVVVEAYLDRKFQLEPVSTDLIIGTRLVLTCIPPKGKPEPEVYWLKDGKRVNKENFAHIILNDYNHLIIENVTAIDGGNYTCVAECLGMEYRYATAKVSITAAKSSLPGSEAWGEWGPCVLTGVTSELSTSHTAVQCQQTRYRLCAHPVASIQDTARRVNEAAVDNCPQPWKQIRNCSSSACPGSSIPNDSKIVNHPLEPQTTETGLRIREFVIYVALVAFIACLLMLLALFLFRRKGTRTSFLSVFTLPCCLKGNNAFHSEKRGIFQKDPLLLSDFKQSTMTIKNPITIDNRKSPCDGDSPNFQNQDMNSRTVSSSVQDPQYSMPLYSSATIFNQPSVGHPSHLLPNSSTSHLTPLPIAPTYTHTGILPSATACLADPLLRHELHKSDNIFLPNAAYCVTSVEPLGLMLPVIRNQNVLTTGEFPSASTTYTQINEYTGKNTIQEPVGLSSCIQITQPMFNVPKNTSGFTDASSGKSSTNTATNTTALGSGNAESSNGSLGIGVAHSPSGLLFTQPYDDVELDSEAQKYLHNSIKYPDQPNQNIRKTLSHSCELLDTDVVTNARVAGGGGLICNSKLGVFMKVPQDALGVGSVEDIYLAICHDDRKRPILGDHQTLLSPIIQFGPKLLKLSHPAIISLPHCAALNEGSWFLRIVATDIPHIAPCEKYGTIEVSVPDAYELSSAFRNYEPVGEKSVTESWKELCTIAAEKDQHKIITSHPEITCQVDGSSVYLVTKYPQRYCLIGETLRSTPEYQTAFAMSEWPSRNHGCRPATKMLRLAAFSARLTPSMDYNIRIYILPDTNDALEHARTVELRLDGYLLDTIGQVPFSDAGQGMCFSIEDISNGWRSRLHADTQEVPFRHIWGGTQLSTLHCAFTLEHIDHTQTTVSCQIIAFQGMNWEQRRILNISSDRFESIPIDTTRGCVPSNLPINYRIQAKARQAICDVLNKQNIWPALAKKLNLESQIPKLTDHENPSEWLLLLWEASHRNDQSLGNLGHIFCQIGQANCASILKLEQEPLWDTQ